jgi:putative RNA 2'-phosphotransferase
MDNRLVRVSKFLSYVLRHRPESIGLSLDGGGWALVDELIATARRAGVSFDEDLLRQVVGQSDKKRLSFSDNCLRIRANYGHSITVDLELQPVVPPEVLYHGTARRFVESIRRQGLRREGRSYVHLSPDEHTAVGVGKRHGKPVVLVVQARCMHDAGFTFYRSESGVWLTEEVPAQHILFPENRCS